MALLRLLIVLLLATGHTLAQAQEVPLEYRVKAAYLANFLRFVEWPGRTDTGPLTICVAGDNPFGAVLEDTVMDSRINGRPVVARVLTEPDDNCHLLFVPDGTPGAAGYLRAAANGPATLTVGEGAGFLDRGGHVAFIREGVNVRFAINPDAAASDGIRISSRLLRLARMP